jgi:hypothetical protein
MSWAFLILLLLSAGTGFAMGRAFSWVVVVTSGVTLALLSSAILHAEGFGAVAGIASIAASLTVSQIIYLAATQSRCTVQDQSPRRPSQVFSMELVQQLLEGFLSCPAGHRHGLKIDRRLLYRALSSGAINLPLPRFRGRCSVLYDN